ncbi:MAG: hypothetical protein HND51_07660 [Chloroflexi bacterium]|nr:hypothetical protein [Chloroflexota bacterium]
MRNSSGWRNPTRQALIVVGLSALLYIYLTIRLGGIGPLDVLYAVYGTIFFRFELVSPNIKALGLDVLLFGIGGTIFWLIFFGQFMLPVYRLEERRFVIDRLLSIITSGRGPAIFVRNGVVVEGAEKKDRSGPGVVLLDTASAAVLQKDTAFTRPVGPGLVFTKNGENITGTVDLRVQVRKLGPKEDEAPFSGRQEGETNSTFEARQNRRLQTSGLTRDGVEVAPSITVAFRVTGKAGEGHTRYGYNSEAVRRAITHEAIDPNAPADAQSRTIPWDWFPAYVTADLWREYLRKYTLNELFEIVPKERNPNSYEAQHTVLQSITHIINARMKSPRVIKLDEYGNPLKETIRSHPYDLLTQHGLQVINVDISNPRLEVEDSFIERWRNSWLQRAKAERKYIQGRQAIEATKGKENASASFAEMSSRHLYDWLLKLHRDEVEPPNLQETLGELVRGTLDGVHRNPPLHQSMIDEEDRLSNLMEWLVEYTHEPVD